MCESLQGVCGASCFFCGEKGGREKRTPEGEDIRSGRDAVGGDIAGSGRWREHRTPEGEDIGPGKDSVGGYN